MSDTAVHDRSRGAGSEPQRGAPHLGWVVAGLSAAAGAIHFAMAPGHAADSLTEALGFALAGWFQLVIAGLIISDRAGRRTYQAAVVGNVVILGLWAWSRTAGLPVGAHPGVSEDAGLVDVTAAILEVGVVLLSARLLLAGERRMAVGRLAPALAAVAALGIATTVITSSDAATHGGDDGHHDEAAAASGDHHGDTGDHDVLMASLDEQRCDTDINHESYWRETEAMGIDTYQGGAMAADLHSDTTGATVVEDPFQGRGSPGLDELVSLTDASGDGELAAAALVAGLAESSEEDYEAWVAWMRRMSSGGGHSDGHDAAAPDDSGHGGHAGPSPWIAMTDPEECQKLKDELAQARDIAMSYPTAQDAMDAGWRRVAPYVQGIAAHYMKFDYVDGEFDIAEPEMLLYDGNAPDANIVGLSYYIIHEGDAEPTQGFTGPNDHFHRHEGLCQGPGGVIGDSTLSEEECAARGGRKANGSKGWMNHTWIVPGCESPWGMFSGATPVLDSQIAQETEKGNAAPACANSSVRERYGLDDGGGAVQAEPVTTKPGG